MRKIIIQLVFLVSLISFFNGCCKEKKECKNGIVKLTPFIERIETFDCNNGESDYTYIFTKRLQIDSLQPTCYFTSPVAFPLDESGMRYILVGRFSTHYKDTLESILHMDTCSKNLTYELNMIQKDTTFWSNGGGTQHIFCAVENIPADYKVEVKYKYVPLP